MKKLQRFEKKSSFFCAVCKKGDKALILFSVSFASGWYLIDAVLLEAEWSTMMSLNVRCKHFKKHTQQRSALALN